jgi:acetyl-CoA carboxylase biotin carboxyl carrier protein
MDPEPAMGSGRAGSEVALPRTLEGAGAGPEPDVDALLGLVDRLADVLAASDLEELEVEAGGTTLRLRRAVADPPPAEVAPKRSSEARPPTTTRPEATARPEVEAGAAPATVGSTGAPEAAPSTGDEAAAPARPSVKAPLTGIWYASPAPGSAPFVQVGGEVAVGQVIGLIEAMKLFNEIKSDLAGRVVRICVENGQLVKAKQPLIEVEPL